MSLPKTTGPLGTRGYCGAAAMIAAGPAFTYKHWMTFMTARCIMTETPMAVISLFRMGVDLCRLKSMIICNATNCSGVG